MQDVYGTSTLTADDSGHIGSDTYDVTNQSVTVGRSSSFFLGFVGGGNGAQAGIARLNLVTGSGAGNAVTVSSTSVPTAVTGLSEGSVVLGGDLGALIAPVTMTGGSTPDSVELDDRNALFQGTYTIAPGAVNRPGFGGLTYNGVNNLTVVGSNANELYDVEGAVAGTHLQLGNGILLASNNGANSSTISDGTLVVTGSLTDPGGVSIGSGALLAGTGSVVGPVTSAGVVAPGYAGTGQLATGNLNLSAGSSFVVDRNSGHTGPVNVTGTVSLGGAALTLSPGFANATGGQFIIVNNDGSDPVVGTFAGLPEGSTIMAGGHTFTISYKGGDGNDVVLTQIAAPTVTGVQINDGSLQRSEVRSIAVTFSEPVTFSGGDANAAAAFQLTHLTESKNVGLNAAVSTNAQGQTVVTLTFAGSETDPVSALNGGVASLADGRYQLTILSAAVSGLGGALAGGGSSSNYVSPADTYGGNGLHLYRLFGDVNGDGVVDATDVGMLKSTFNRNNTDPLYLWYLDADNSGSVDASDIGQFKSRFNVNVFG